MRYRAKESIIAVRYGQPKPFKFGTIKPGSIITLQGEIQPSGLVSLVYDGQIVAAFMRDIESRAERIQAESA